MEGGPRSFRVARALRLSSPLLYALIIPTLFHEWYYAHTVLPTAATLYKDLAELSCEIRQVRKDMKKCEKIQYRTIHGERQLSPKFKSKLNPIIVTLERIISLP